ATAEGLACGARERDGELRLAADHDLALERDAARLRVDEEEAGAVGRLRGDDEARREGGRGHEVLRAVELRAGAVPRRRRPRRERIVVAVFDDAGGEHDVALGDAGEERGLLRGGAELADRHGAADERRPEGQRRRRPAGGFEEEPELDEAEPAAAVLLVDR